MRDISLNTLSPWCGSGHGGGLSWYRVVVIAALVASVVVTWPLWNVRESPPLLPVLPVAPLSLGVPLVVACLAALVTPRAGAVAVTAIVVYGMSTDQTRMQPEFFSLPILLWGTLGDPGPRLFARMHLIALWFYAGLHKLLSPEFIPEAGPRLIGALPLPVPGSLLPLAALGIAALEIGTALLAASSRTRRWAAWSALILHAGILLTLSPLVDSRNPAVWPWNVALAVSGFALIAPWTGSLLSAFAHAALTWRVLGAGLVVMPAGYYLGVVDAYPAHHLYSAATARATIHCPTGCREDQDINATWHVMNVPLPPEPRIYQASFAATCAPGDVMKIVLPRPPILGREEPPRLVSCPDGRLPLAHP